VGIYCSYFPRSLPSIRDRSAGETVGHSWGPDKAKVTYNRYLHYGGEYGKIRRLAGALENCHSAAQAVANEAEIGAALGRGGSRDL